MAALGLALSDFLVLYSRTALTDVLFVTLFVTALAAFTLAETRKSTWWAVLAGAATGLAWNTKYHGWLAAAIREHCRRCWSLPMAGRTGLAGRVGIAGAVRC
jgi:4-amino-4-deoxy-L-arabinose transferase-like glycosyltransferase